MTFCSDCANKMDDSDKFCSECGKNLREDKSVKKMEKIPYSEQGAKEDEIKDMERESKESINYSFTGYHAVDGSPVHVFLTEKFILLRFGRIQKSIRKIPYKTISSVKLKEGWTLSEITLFGQHLEEKIQSKPRYGSMGILQLESESGLRIKNIDKKHAKKATEFIENMIY